MRQTCSTCHHSFRIEEVRNGVTICTHCSSIQRALFPVPLIVKLPYWIGAVVLLGIASFFGCMAIVYPDEAPLTYITLWMIFTLMFFSYIKPPTSD